MSQYSYDGAGRLVAATIPHHQLGYGFGTATGCGTGSNASAGLDGNRTSFSDSLDAGTAWTAGYCYDSADRLISTTVAGAPSGASPVAGTSLSMSGTASLGYDVHGNTTTLADETIGYDSTDRHATTVAGGVTVTYVRDVTNRIIKRTTTGTGASTVYYSYNDGSDSPDWTLPAIGSGTVLEHTLALPGGVTISVQNAGATWVYAYPNIHGDVVVTASGTGTRGALAQYDPFGNPLDPATWKIATTTADDAGPNTTTQPTASYGWEGSHQRLNEHTGSISTIEMGARQYVPLLGRFLSVDPVIDGNVNSYNYPDDSVNNSDVSGRRAHHRSNKLVRRGSRLTGARVSARKPVKSSNSRLRQVMWGLLEITAGSALIRIGTGLDVAGMTESVAGLFFEPETFGFSTLVAVVGFFEAVVGVAFFALGAVLVLDGISRVARGRGLWHGRGGPFRYLEPPSWFLR